MANIKIDLSGIDPRTDTSSPDFDPEYFKAYYAAYQEHAPELREIVKGRILDIMTGLVSDPEEAPAPDPERRADYERQLAEIRQKIQQAAEKATSAVYDEVITEIENAPQQLALDGFEPQPAAVIDEAMQRKEIVTQLLSELQAARIPAQMIRPIDAITQTLFNNGLEPGIKENIYSGPATKAKVNGKIAKVPIEAAAALSLTDLPPNVQISREMTPFDNAVFNAIVSLYEDGTFVFTASKVYQTMTGQNGTRPTEEMRQKIEESIARLSFARIVIDSKTVGDAYSIEFKRSAQVLEIRALSVKFENQAGHIEETVFRITARPLLMEYANLLNQVQRYSALEFNTPVNKTPDIITLQNYLLFRIHAIPRLDSHILYDAIWENIGIAQENKSSLYTRKKRLRSYIKTMLDYWQGMGIIAGWTEETKGRTVRAIVIRPGRALKAKKEPAALPAPQNDSE